MEIDREEMQRLSKSIESSEMLAALPYYKDRR